MSSGAFAQARALYRKAAELDAKGHLLRAAEIFGRAAEAARALDSGPDNLVVVGMQRNQGHMLLNYALAVDDATFATSALAAHRAECVALLSAAMAALERRRVADTLLEGKCTAAEEAWNAADWTVAGHSADEAARQAKLVGYNTFLRVADSSMCLLRNARWFAAECAATQFEAFTQHVVHAVDLMQQPRSQGTAAMRAEILFAERLSSAFVADASGVPYLQSRGLNPRLVQLLTDAWQRLQRSGVLEARGILDDSLRRQLNTYQEKNLAAAQAAMSAPGLRSCALAGCGAKEAHPQHFKRCSACRTVVYCSKEHQLEAWPAHKAACKAARKAAAAASDGAGAGPGAA